MTTDVTAGSIEALDRDIAFDAGFHAHKWKEVQDTHPNLAHFINDRIRRLMGQDSDSARLCLAITIEALALEEKMAFSSTLGRLVVIPEVYEHLSEMQPVDQLEMINRTGFEIA